jgi:hypothetical protein
VVTRRGEWGCGEASAAHLEIHRAQCIFRAEDICGDDRVGRADSAVVSACMQGRSSVAIIVPVRMIGSPPPPLSSSSSPIATPATTRLSGTPAAIMESAPPQTDAMEDEPHDSVIKLSTRTTYGNSLEVGIAGARA